MTTPRSAPSFGHLTAPVRNVFGVHLASMASAKYLFVVQAQSDGPRERAGTEAIPSFVMLLFSISFTSSLCHPPQFSGGSSYFLRRPSVFMLGVARRGILRDSSVSHGERPARSNPGRGGQYAMRRQFLSRWPPLDLRGLR